MGKCVFEMMGQLNWIKQKETREGRDDNIYNDDDGDEIIVTNKLHYRSVFFMSITCELVRTLISTL